MVTSSLLKDVFLLPFLIQVAVAQRILQAHGDPAPIYFPMVVTIPRGM